VNPRLAIWKVVVVVFTLGVGLLYGLPNAFPDDPALQISPARSTETLSTVDLDRASQALVDAGIEVLGAEVLGNQGLFRFETVETQITAKAVVQKTLGPEFIVALNLAPTTPQWLQSIGANPMKLGLDLRGGVHFLMEVDLEAAVNQRLDAYASEIKQMLRTERIRFRSVEVETGNQIAIRFLDAETRVLGLDRIREEYVGAFAFRDEERGEAAFLTLLLSESEIANVEDYAVSQNLTTLRNRVNELGVSDPWYSVRPESDCGRVPVSDTHC
jgi:Preprotein translocase subunit SecD